MLPSCVLEGMKKNDLNTHIMSEKTTHFPTAHECSTSFYTLRKVNVFIVHRLCRETRITGKGRHY